MGIAWCKPESGSWDTHPEINEPYKYREAGPPTHDMHAPLSHYFISSGHNSYLTRDQLLGASGTSTIIMSLERGCRVIELDCYDAPRGSEEPECKHGGTATKAISFRTCVKAIRDHGFKFSPYPVIITLENHTHGAHQASLAAILKQELGSSLFIPPSEPQRQWLSPEALKGMFIIRTNLKDAIPELKEIVYIANSSFKGCKQMSALPHVTSSSLNENKIRKIAGKVPSMLKESASMNYRGKGAPPHIDSLVVRGTEEEIKEEEEALEAEGNLQDVFKYTKTHLLRVYPAGWRVDSGNYDPTVAWGLGASLAALNWQAWDKPCWINEAKFRDNGGCGYIKKPQWMLDDVSCKYGLPLPEPRVLSIHVYSVCYPQKKHQLCCGRDDLMLVIDVKGMAVDTRKAKTDYATDSGRLLVDKTYDFPVYFPDLAVLVMALQDYDEGTADDSLGYFSISLGSIETGELKIQTLGLDGKPVPDSWIKASLSWKDQADVPLKVSDIAASIRDV